MEDGYVSANMEMTERGKGSWGDDELLILKCLRPQIPFSVFC
jgi:hypothetical protein